MVPRFFLKRTLSVIFGMVVGITTMFAALTLVLTVAFPQPTEAQTATSCFKKGECLDGNTSVRCGADGCCNDKHCFLPDASCNTPDNTTDNGRCYVKSQPINLEFAIGDRKQVIDLGDYIAAVYTYAVSVAGIFAIVMMMIGGFQWLTSRDNASAAAAAKERIANALIGLAMTLFAYLVLQTVNPDLVLLRLPKIEVVKHVDFALVACENTGMCYACGEKYGVKMATDASGKKVPPPTGKCEFTTTNLNDPDVIIVCNGLGCQKSDSSCTDAGHRCIFSQKGSPNFCSELSEDEVANTSGQFQYFCNKCEVAGTACSPDGRNNSCCGGYCNDGVCGNGENGEECNKNSSCKSGICTGALPGISGICTSGSIGSFCTTVSGSECAADALGRTVVCSTEEKMCLIDGYEATIQKANRIAAIAAEHTFDFEEVFNVIQLKPTLTVGGYPKGNDIFIGDPARDADPRYTTSGTPQDPHFTFTDTALERNICITDGGHGSDNCPSGMYCAVVANRVDNNGFTLGIGVCTDGEIGDPCMDNRCSTGFCAKPSFVTIGTFEGGAFAESNLGTCTNGDPGDGCQADSQCKSRHCPFFGFGAGVCSTGLEGAVCHAEDDNPCEPGFTCQDSRCLKPPAP